MEKNLQKKAMRRFSTYPLFLPASFNNLARQAAVQKHIRIQDGNQHTARNQHETKVTTLSMGGVVTVDSEGRLGVLQEMVQRGL